MIASATNWLQEALTHRNPWMRALAILIVCLAMGIPVGAVIGLMGGLFGSGLLIGMAVAAVMLRSAMVGIMMLCAVICLLPFGALPIDIGFTPTFLDLILIGTFFVWISHTVTHRDEEFVSTSPTLLVIIFVLLAIVSFVNGLSHAVLTANVLRHFGEILLSVVLFMVVTNTLRTVGSLKMVVGALILFGFIEALVGIGLYFLPPLVSTKALSALDVVGYPTGSDVLRYIEDNPELAQRAIATSIDPNVLGGMLIFVTTLTAAQLMAPKPLFRRGWLWIMLGTMGFAMVLTFSRGSFAGLLAALFALGLLRYRRALGVAVLILALVLLLPPAQVYVNHFVEGLRGQDLATQMRFGEYRDSLTLIGRYPWFGVGFAGSPDIDTYVGVSNVYLLIGEEMGILGMVTFVSILVVFLINFMGVRRQATAFPELESILLGSSLAIFGGLMGGMFDHYLFNLDFPHASSLLWLTLGVGTAGARLVRQMSAAQPAGAVAADDAAGPPIK